MIWCPACRCESKLLGACLGKKRATCEPPENMSQMKYLSEGPRIPLGTTWLLSSPSVRKCLLRLHETSPWCWGALLPLPSETPLLSSSVSSLGTNRGYAFLRCDLFLYIAELQREGKRPLHVRDKGLSGSSSGLHLLQTWGLRDMDRVAQS